MWLLKVTEDAVVCWLRTYWTPIYTLLVWLTSFTPSLAQRKLDSGNSDLNSKVRFVKSKNLLNEVLLVQNKSHKRPRQRNGVQGQMGIFEEGILCQRNNVFPGLEAKMTTGADDNAAGWYAAIISVVRRLIMEGRTFGNDTETTMAKTSINIRDVNRKKANTILKALRSYEETVVSYNIGRRRQVPAGKVVSDYITESAALLKRLFMAKTEGRLKISAKKFTVEESLENDRCFSRLGGYQKRTVLRFCKNCNYDIGCPINIIFAKFMTRSLQFIKEFNGLKHSRMMMIDLFTSKEIEVFTNSFLRDNRTRTIAAVGSRGHGVLGIEDELYHDASPISFRLLDGNIPEDLLMTVVDDFREPFPNNMREDIIHTDYVVDIDVLPTRPPALIRPAAAQAQEEAQPEDQAEVQENAPGNDNVAG